MPRPSTVAHATRDDNRIEDMARLLAELVAERCCPDATYEQQRDEAAAVMAKVMCRHENRQLRELVITAAEIEIDGVRYRRLDQPSSATYFGRWGGHEIVEPLYRATEVRNGPTVKPLELRAGIVARRMTPDLARIVGKLSAYMTSREVHDTLCTVGFEPPGRAFIEKRTKTLTEELSQDPVGLEAEIREFDTIPAEIASISCGLDRMAVRMTEPAALGDPRPKRCRSKPYVRTPPPPRQLNWRMAWVGTMTAYDADGDALRTWRYGADAQTPIEAIIDRVVADVSWILAMHSGIPVVCIQDGAAELEALARALGRLTENTRFYDVVDFHHLLGYLDGVVAATEPEGDPHSKRDWYRHELLHHDGAIQRIRRQLQYRQQRTCPRDEHAAEALHSAITYIAKRTRKMRYAAMARQNLPIGSGATESTCALMQLRVKRPGMAWETPGLRGIMTIRGVVLSDRWAPAWNIYAARHRSEVRSIH